MLRASRERLSLWYNLVHKTRKPFYMIPSSSLFLCHAHQSGLRLPFRTRGGRRKIIFWTGNDAVILLWMSPNASTTLLLLTHRAVYTPHRLSGRIFCHLFGDSFVVISLMSTFKLVMMKCKPKEPACRARCTSIRLSGEQVSPALRQQNG